MFQDFNSYNQYYGINGAFNNQGLNANNLSNGFDFRTMNSNVNNEEIITLAQGVDLIRQSVSDEREDEMFYDSLIKKARTEQEKKIITEIEIYNDTLKMFYNESIKDIVTSKKYIGKELILEEERY